MSTPLMVPQLRSYTQPFADVDTILLEGSAHQLGPCTLQTLIVHVWELNEGGERSVPMEASGYQYGLDTETQDVLVTLTKPCTGTVVLTTFGPSVPMPHPETMPLGAVPPAPVEPAAESAAKELEADLAAKPTEEPSA